MRAAAGIDDCGAARQGGEQLRRSGCRRSLASAAAGRRGCRIRPGSPATPRPGVAGHARQACGATGSSPTAGSRSCASRSSTAPAQHAQPHDPDPAGLGLRHPVCLPLAAALPVQIGRQPAMQSEHRQRHIFDHARPPAPARSSARPAGPAGRPARSSWSTPAPTENSMFQIGKARQSSGQRPGGHEADVLRVVPRRARCGTAGRAAARRKCGPRRRREPARICKETPSRALAEGLADQGEGADVPRSA